MYRSPFLLLSIFCLGLSACATKQKMATNTYKNSILDWQKERAASITAPDGWLSLVGLFWLKEGATVFGSAKTNRIRFPQNTPEKIGQFIVEEGGVSMEIAPNVPVKIGDSSPKKMLLQPDNSGNPTHANLGSVNWHLIKRANRYGIRVRDSENAAIQSFKGIPYFPIEEKWKIPARLKPANKDQTITLRNVVDMDVEMKLAGYLVFEINGTTYELEAMNSSGQRYFIIFADATTGETTYGAGRYLYVPKVDTNGKTYIDFNKAYNPPCAFTDFATCPLPSEKNQLDVAIEAGEKDYH